MVAKRAYDANASIRESLDSSCQGMNRWFVLAYEGGANRVTADSHKRYFLPRVEVKNYNIEFDGRNCYDQPINNKKTNDLIKQYDELRKVSTGQGDDYTNYRLIAADISKQKALNTDSRAIHQIIYTGKVNAAVVIYCIYEKSKETVLEFYKGTTKVL